MISKSYSRFLISSSRVPRQSDSYFLLMLTIARSFFRIAIASGLYLIIVSARCFFSAVSAAFAMSRLTCCTSGRMLASARLSSNADGQIPVCGFFYGLFHSCYVHFITSSAIVLYTHPALLSGETCEIGIPRFWAS